MRRKREVNARQEVGLSWGDLSLESVEYGDVWQPLIAGMKFLHVLRDPDKLQPC